MAHGAAHLDACGPFRKMLLNPEKEVCATPDRLKWMIENVDLLVPKDGREWQTLRKRLADGKKGRALATLRAGKPLSKGLVFEGPTHADCLIECERAFIWIEGKRFDWLTPCTTWDVTRDQLARNVEALRSFANEPKPPKEYRLLICHEHQLKHHERLLLEGYRSGTWSAGWPHIPEGQRREFSTRIGTLKWAEIVREWPAMRQRPELHDLSAELPSMRSCCARHSPAKR
jgi:hypothetical protein